MISLLIAIDISKKMEQVVARWHPVDARRADIEDAPVFYPTEEVNNVCFNISVILSRDLALYCCTLHKSGSYSLLIWFDPFTRSLKIL